jgi:hypothetical protein
MPALRLDELGTATDPCDDRERGTLRLHPM